MGRPKKKLSEDEKRQVEKLAAYLNAEQIADFLCISRRTFFNMLSRDDELNALYKKGSVSAIAVSANSLMSKVRAGNLTAIIFHLKTKGGWRETDPSAATSGNVSDILSELITKLHK